MLLGAVVGTRLLGGAVVCVVAVPWPAGCVVVDELGAGSATPTWWLPLCGGAELVVTTPVTTAMAAAPTMAPAIRKSFLFHIFVPFAFVGRTL